MKKKPTAEQRKRWRAAADPARVRAATHKRTCKLYGITPAQYAELLAKQGGGCAICGDPPTSTRDLSIDHDHTTGKVRGLLCNCCNPGLGYFKDNESRLHRAIAYLRENKNAD